jgi:cobyrinic acid a,c-diamide synthase
LPEGAVIKGHEFHYYESENSGEDCLAIKPVTKKSYPCVISGENCFMGFPHLYYPSNPAFAEAFVEKAVIYLKRS